MKNRILCILIALVFVLALLPSVALADDADNLEDVAVAEDSAEAEGLDNFVEKNKFTNQTFADVSTDDWFYTNVAYVYVYGLMVGTSDTTFTPKGNVKLSEAVTVAARLNMIYTTGAEITADPDADSTGKWYDHYVDYAKENGIIESDYEDYEKAATRAEFAEILAAALPDEALEEINVVVDNAIPDVSAYEDYADAVYKLYRAGIIVGNDDNGTFNPDRNITRAEIAAIISRMISREQRKSVTLNSTIERFYDENGSLILERVTDYNKYALPVSSHEQCADGTTIDTEITYDEQILAPVKMVEKSGSHTTTVDYFYNADGYAIKLVLTSDKDDAETNVLYTVSYDDAGTVTLITASGTARGEEISAEYDCPLGTDPLEVLRSAIEEIIG